MAKQKKEKTQKQSQRDEAEIEHETIRQALAKVEGRAHEAKLAEDVNMRILVDRANAEREKWVAAINTTFEHIGGTFLPDAQYANTYTDNLRR